MTAPRTTLLIPSETRTREFDAKLLLACFAVERGYDCVVGSRVHLHLAVEKLPVGLYIAKDMLRSSARILRILTGLGHDVVGWDEESLIYLSEETYLRRRVSPRTTKFLNRVFTWGEEDRAMKSRAQEFRGIPIESVGNPRIDLLRPELRDYFADDVAELREQYGNFILINSNFGTLNHILPARRIVPSKMSASAIASFSENQLPFDYWQFREQMLEEFKQMVPAVAKSFPNHRVIIRPHPAENHGLWLALAEGHPNVMVANHNSIVPWLLATDVVIHNGCTTGLEAYLLGRPVICYQPVTHPLYDLELPNGVSERVGDLPGLIAQVSYFLENGPAERADESKEVLAHRYLVGIDGPLACERIVEALMRHIATTPRRATAASARQSAVAKARIRRLSKQLMALIPGSKNSPGYTRHRFSDLKPADVESRLEKFRTILGRFDGVHAVELRPNIFRIART